MIADLDRDLLLSWDLQYFERRAQVLDAPRDRTPPVPDDSSLVLAYASVRRDYRLSVSYLVDRCMEEFGITEQQAIYIVEKSDPGNCSVYWLREGKHRLHFCPEKGLFSSWIERED